MRSIHCDQIRDAIAAMCQRANFEMTSDVRMALNAGVERETSPLAKNTLLRILQNADVAKNRSLPMC